MSLARHFTTAFKATSWVASGTCLCLIAACSSSQSAAFSAIRSAVRPNAAIDSRPLDPKLTYLRVTSNGKALLMVLGYVEPPDTPDGPQTQVWYSATGEVLRLRQGRLAGVVGTPVEWRAVRWPDGLPDWHAHGLPQKPYSRERDQMPGYQLGVKDTLLLEPLPAPRDSDLLGDAAQSLHWFQERSVHGGLQARYAVNQVNGAAVPVYGEQCLAPDFCLTWQSWPPLQKSPS